MSDEGPEATEESEAPARRRHGASPALLITSEDFEALAPEWAALHGEVPGATPFTHPAWHRAWLRHFGRDVAPVFLAVRREEQLVGVAALDMASGAARELGDPNVRDYAGPLALPGLEGGVAAGVVEWLMEDLTTEAEFWGIAEDSAMREGLANGAARFGWSTVESLEAVTPRAALPSDWEAYLAGLTKHDRHELRRKLRHPGEAGAVSFEHATSPEDVASGMGRFLELMRISRGDKEAFLTPEMEAFFRDVGESLAELGMARLSTLWLDGAAIAMTLSFEDTTTAYLYNSGYDPAFSKLAPGLVSKAFALRAAIERGKQTFDFLRGDEAYKRHLGGQARQVLTVRLRQG